MKTSSSAMPGFRYTNRSAEPASRKYSARRPRTAKALEVNTTNRSLVTPNTAGIESSANTTSVTAMATRATSRGVAMARPPARVTYRPSS